MNHTAKRNIYAIFLVLIISIVSGGFAFAGGTSETKTPQSTGTETTVIRLGVLRGPTAIGFTPVLMNPRNPGWPGYVLEPEIFATPDLLVSQVLAGRVDVAAVPTNLAAVMYNQGAEIVMVGVIGTGVLYMVSDEPLGWEDLRGRTVHTIAKGATPDILFQALAVKQGLTPGEDFTIEYATDQVELAQNLIAGRRNLAVLPEPFVTRVISAGPDLKAVLDLQTEWNRIMRNVPASDESTSDEAAPRSRESSGYPMTALIATREFVRETPDALDVLIQAYRSGLTDLESDVATYAQHSESLNLGLDAATIIAAYPRLNITWIPSHRARREIEVFLGVLHERNPRSIGGVLPDDGFYTDPDNGQSE
jgi:NitT/TauT family transport system substrate-binding protein